MTVTILQGDCREVLKTLPDESVHCVVTSPPYYGLRDYQTAKWEGGDSECNHRAPDEAGKTDKPTSGQREHAGRFAGPYCYRCGAIRIDSQIGLEQTPDAYVAEMVGVFREVRRVLRKDGTVWLVIGDSYAGSWGSQGRQGNSGQMSDRSVANARERSKIQAARIEAGAYPSKVTRTGQIPKGSGLKPKDLIGIPWRIAFALQADGWWLRKDNIWAKGNPMPESCSDRTTSSHEYVFHLSKSDRYFYDAESIKEASVSDHTSGNGFKRPQQISRGGRGNDDEWDNVGGTRNRRSVWSINTKPFPEAHFAVMPTALAEICIKAGCPESGTVLDPFLGAGTAALVADKLSRHCIGIELNPKYATMAERRIALAKASPMDRAAMLAPPQQDDGPLFKLAGE